MAVRQNCVECPSGPDAMPRGQFQIVCLPKRVGWGVGRGIHRAPSRLSAWHLTSGRFYLRRAEPGTSPPGEVWTYAASLMDRSAHLRRITTWFRESSRHCLIAIGYPFMTFTKRGVAYLTGSDAMPRGHFLMICLLKHAVGRVEL
jgi:hypothetical protein